MIPGQTTTTVPVHGLTIRGHHARRTKIHGVPQVTTLGPQHRMIGIPQVLAMTRGRTRQKIGDVWFLAGWYQCVMVPTGQIAGIENFPMSIDNFPIGIDNFPIGIDNFPPSIDFFPKAIDFFPISMPNGPILLAISTPK
ncbi:hypothetical protein [Geobacter sp. OR-1]|uniref:hypothetical protein n=1 Tax=Geobacter sp. OR-1 TaxID=1266765 RepID=UPI001269B641|nr:hypothetical protein [Geobacter sp. OR-1]